MRFTFVVTGWPGCAHDSRVLNHAIAHFFSFPVPPKGKYYLVDSGYANRIGHLAPFKGSMYHLPEFRLRRHRPPQGNMSCSTFHIPLFAMSLSVLLECSSRNGAY
uniref:DDE Tnp4 domain-containing protein n=1 Tax=Hordeum vulgare subsp. vulgare TaxID=112509 RepID=A0A8I6XDJ7_HORVV